MKTEFAIWMVSYLIRRGPDTQENIINEWSKYINEDVEIHRNTFGNYRKKLKNCSEQKYHIILVPKNTT